MQAIIATIGIVLLIVLPMLFDEWHARRMFISCGYCRRHGHGKSFNRAKKHYKTNWTWRQRMLWMPITKERYEIKYKIMAYLSYTHFILTFVVLFCFLANEFVFQEIMFWHYAFIGTTVFFIVRFIYDNSVGKSSKV